MNVRFFRCAALVAVLAAALALSAAPAQAGSPTSRLLAAYQPVTIFDQLERFAPTKVQSFISDSNLERLDASGTWVLADSDPEPGELPGPGSGVWRLNQDSCTPAAAIGGLACYEDAAATGGGGSAVYGRVVRQDDRIVLQYWYFYYDDVYSYAYPPSDFIWQAHEGDWEVVNVVLSADEEPLSVGYSQHCLGQRRSWEATPRFEATHPIVHVAIGSHANFFSAGTHPIDIRCIPIAALAIFQRNGLPLPVDYTSDGAAAGPPEADGAVTTIHQIDDDVPAWVSFPGFWGELQYFHAPAPIGTLPFGASPVGPAYHLGVWNDPLGTLLTWSAG